MLEGRARPCPLADPCSTYQHGRLSPLRRRDVGATLINDGVKRLEGAFLKVQIRRILELRLFPQWRSNPVQRH